MLLEEHSWFHEGSEYHRGIKTPDYRPLGEEDEEGVEVVRYVAYGVVAPITVSIGIFGNVWVILLLRLPQFKGVVFSLFSVLAAADLLSLGFCISPLYHALNTATLHHSTAVWYSYFELLLVGVFMSTSVIIVVCITVYRFFSVCRPAEIQRFNTLRFPRLSVALAICTSVIAWFPLSLVMQPRISGECKTSSFTPPDNQTWWVSCLVHDTKGKGYFIAYVWVREVTVTFLPILLVVTLNLLTLRGFLQHRRTRRRILTHRTSVQASVKSKNKEENYLMGLLIAVMTSFVVTVVPSGIANAINMTANTSKMQFVIFSAVADNLLILNHALNFYLYILCSKQVRDTLVEYYEKYRGRRTWRDLCVWREGKGKSEASCEGDGKYSESPNNRKSGQIYVVSSSPMPSEPPLVLSDGDKENKQNEVLQRTYDNSASGYDARVSLAEPDSYVNPNFDLSL